jgi:murein L,D-transpeptidase YafK
MIKIIPFLLFYLVSCGYFPFQKKEDENRNSNRQIEIPAQSDTLYSIEIPPPSSPKTVSKIQRILSNECDEWRLIKDGLWGPKTSEAFQRCWNKCGTPPIENVEAFIDELWHRKLALILLHQFGYLKGKYKLYNRHQIEDALNELSTTLEIHPSIELNITDLNRLYQWYIDYPPVSSLGAILQNNELPFSGLEILLQVFKLDREVHVFARQSGSDDEFIHLKEFRITSFSNYPFTPGPKTVEGDGKVPEGIYRLTWQNEWSTFYIGYPISYPNDTDRIRSSNWEPGRSLGGAIVLHGEDASIGCIPVGNPSIEELFLLLNKNWRRGKGYGQIHIFPCQFGVEENEEFLQEMLKEKSKIEHTNLVNFWDSLRPIYLSFAKHKRVPKFNFDQNSGYYIFLSESQE